MGIVIIERPHEINSFEKWRKFPKGMNRLSCKLSIKRQNSENGKGDKRKGREHATR